MTKLSIKDEQTKKKKAQNRAKDLVCKLKKDSGRDDLWPKETENQIAEVFFEFEKIDIDKL